MADELVDSVLDDLIHEVAQSSLDIIDRMLPNISNDLRVQYLGRTLSEILSVVIVSAPAEEVNQTCDRLCNFIRTAVGHNVSIEAILSKAFDKKTEATLTTKFKDSLLIAKKASA